MPPNRRCRASTFTYTGNHRILVNFHWTASHHFIFGHLIHDVSPNSASTKRQYLVDCPESSAWTTFDISIDITTRSIRFLVVMTPSIATNTATAMASGMSVFSLHRQPEVTHMCRLCPKAVKRAEHRNRHERSRAYLQHNVTYGCSHCLR